jgi:hypothetical protein
VRQLALPDLRVDRHHRDPGDQRADGGDAGLDGRRRPDSDPVPAAQLLREVAGEPGELAVGQLGVGEAQRGPVAAGHQFG